MSSTGVEPRPGASSGQNRALWLDAVRPVAVGSTQRTAQARGAIRAGAR